MKKTILLIDDDARFRALILLFAGELNCDVIQCRCLKGARSSMSSSNFDLLIVDKDMPDGDGLEWLREARRSGVTTPAILISACVDDRVSFKELLELDVCLLLQKPVSMLSLKEEIGILLGMEDPQDPDEQEEMAQLEKIKAEFAKELPLLLRNIKTLIQKAGSSELSHSALREAARQAHVLRGTAAIFGFGALGPKMAFLEDELQKYPASEMEPIDPAILKQLEAFLDELLFSVELRRPSTPLFRTLRCRRLPRVIGFSADNSFSRRLKHILSSEGMVAYTFDKAHDLPELILEIEPALVIFDSCWGAGSLRDCLKVCAHSRVPVAILISQETLNEPDILTELQGCTLLDKKMSNQELLFQFKRVLNGEHKPIFGSVTKLPMRSVETNETRQIGKLSIA